MTSHNLNYLVNCLIVSNATATSAGARLFGTPTILVNSTIIFNESQAGAIFGSEAAILALTNCIVYYNTVDMHINPGEEIQATYTCTSSTNGLTGPGNITNAPVFRGRGPHPFTHKHNSPCIDSGIQADNPSTGTAITNDIAGTPRPLDGTGDGLALYDIGAYEYILPQKGTLFYSQ